MIELHLNCVYPKTRDVTNLSIEWVCLPKACQAYANPVYDALTTLLAEYRAGLQSAIEMLLTHASLRRRMGTAGCQKVENDYSLQVWGPRVANMLRRVANHGNNT